MYNSNVFMAILITSYKAEIWLCSIPFYVVDMYGADPLSCASLSGFLHWNPTCDPLNLNSDVTLKHGYYTDFSLL